MLCGARFWDPPRPQRRWGPEKGGWWIPFGWPQRPAFNLGDSFSGLQIRELCRLNPVNCFDVIYERRPGRRLRFNQRSGSSGIKMETLFAIKEIIFVRIIVQSLLLPPFEMESLFISLWRTRRKPGTNGNVIVPSHLVFMLLPLSPFCLRSKKPERKEIFSAIVRRDSVALLQIPPPHSWVAWILFSMPNLGLSALFVCRKLGGRKILWRRSAREEIPRIN